MKVFRDMPILIKQDELDSEYYHGLCMGKIYKEYVPKNIPSRAYEDIKVSKDESTFKLIDKSMKDTLSLVYGVKKTYYEMEYFEIIWTYSKIQQRGFLTYLLDLVINDFGCIILSDQYHTTPGSKEFWKAHIRKKKFEIYSLNLLNNEKKFAKDCEEDSIWGFELKKDFPNFVNDFEDYVDMESDENSNVDYIEDLIESIEKNPAILQVFDTEYSVVSKEEDSHSSKKHMRLIAK